MALVTATLLLLPVFYVSVFLDFILLITGFFNAITAVVFVGFRAPSIRLVCLRLGSINPILDFKF